MAISDEPIERLDEAEALPDGQIGEICVSGPTVTDSYWRRDDQTRAAKMTDSTGNVWHRMGDLGCIDTKGRIWYCGRKSERVITAGGTLFTECVEGRVSAVAGVFRSAVVGVGRPGRVEPVVIIEPEAGADRRRVEAAVRNLLAGRPESRSIKRILFHRRFPVDIRHNARIRRAQLAA